MLVTDQGTLLLGKKHWYEQRSFTVAWKQRDTREGDQPSKRRPGPHESPESCD